MPPPPFLADVEPYLKSLWGAKAHHNETAEWIRRKERSTISNIDWGPKQILEIHFCQTSQLDISWK
jgi:hypothetical protein